MDYTGQPGRSQGRGQERREGPSRAALLRRPGKWFV